jgi:hypothetical protein
MILQDVDNRPTDNRFLMIMSPGSRVNGLGYCSIAVTRTTRESSKTGWSLIIAYLRKDFDQRKFALQNTPPNSPRICRGIRRPGSGLGHS